MTEKFVAESRRPLVLAEKLRSGLPVLMVSTPTKNARPIAPSEFAGAVPVVLDAVSDWFDEQGSTRWPDDRLRSNYRLPWPRVWAEYRDHAAEADPALGGGKIHKGLLMREHSIGDLLERIPALRKRGVPKSAVYGVIVLAFMWNERHSFAVSIDPLVFFSKENGDGCRDLQTSTESEKDDDYNHGTDFASFAESFDMAKESWNELGVWRLFTAWLQVKNVEVADVQIDRASRRRAERMALADKGPPPWIKYKTLALTMPKSASSGDSGSSDGPEGPVPFHLVRGHLADYRRGRGLFGKWKSVVWVPMHTRGKQMAGCIAKSYEAQMKGE